MEATTAAAFHKLYGIRKPRVFYNEKDFADYVLMILLCALAVGVSYGFRHAMSMAGYVLCAIMLATFVVRHGIGFRVPVILRRPQDVLFMFVYKFRNMKPMYFAALALLLLENFAIAATPTLPHHVELMRRIGLTLFYIHVLSITVYRTVILTDHLAKKALVREVLMQTTWRRVIKAKTSIVLEIVHAYCTGLLTHVIMIAPWYLVLRYFSFSLLFLPAVCVLNVIVHLKWWKTYNAWFYRDHWLGHNSEFEFLFLHGSHHDAIPSSLLAVAENGFLEGYLRFTIGWPVPFYNPVVSFLIIMYDVKTDIDLHQYIPGVFPRISLQMMEVIQHSTHHYGPLEPYGVGVKVDQPGVSEAFKDMFKWIPEELKNSARLDEELTGFKWDNPTHQMVLSLYEKYQV